MHDPVHSRPPFESMAYWCHAAGGLNTRERRKCRHRCRASGSLDSPYFHRECACRGPTRWWCCKRWRGRRSSRWQWREGCFSRAENRLSAASPQARITRALLGKPNVYPPIGNESAVAVAGWGKPLAGIMPFRPGCLPVPGLCVRSRWHTTAIPGQEASGCPRPSSR